MANGNFKRKILLSQNPNCHLCGFPVLFPGVKVKQIPELFHILRSTIDHIVPKSFGGTRDLCNLRLAHNKCNSIRGNKTIEECAEQCHNEIETILLMYFDNVELALKQILSKEQIDKFYNTPKERLDDLYAVHGNINYVIIK